MNLHLSRRLRHRMFAVTLIFPAVLLLSITIIIPLARAIHTSLLDYSLLAAEHPWNHFSNYVAILSSVDFYHSLKITLIFVFSVVCTELIFGMVTALILNANIKFKSFFRSIIMIPWAIPTIVAALIFLWIYQGDYGVLNYILLKTGIIDKNLNLLNNTSFALIAIMGVTVWRQTPLMVVMILAGLQSIPASLYEAAKIDGANGIRSFIHITLPSLKPVLANITLLMVVANFQMFTLFYTLTNGGPVDATESLAILTYKTAFEKYDLGQGATIGVIWMIILLIFSSLFTRLGNRGND